MTTPFLIAALVVAVAGVALSTQAPINAALSRSLASPLAAAAVSFGLGFVILTVLTLVTAGPRPFLQIGSVPVWMLAGGALGAFYVWAVVWGVAQLGVLTMVAALILGQMLAALVLDASGAFGLAVQALSPTRLGAAALVAAGLVLSRL
jgi:transporter family-2 protein